MRYMLCKAGKAKSLSVNQIQTNCFWPRYDWTFGRKRKNQLKKDKIGENKTLAQTYSRSQDYIILLIGKSQLATKKQQIEAECRDQ